MSSFRILVVDDHPDNAKMVAMLLGLHGHTCRAATSGVEGLAVAEEMQPQIAIVDIGMPDISGYDVARALRERFGPAIVLVALTGWGQHEDRAKAFAAGFDQHVVKPADAAVLRKIVADAAQSLA